MTDMQPMPATKGHLLFALISHRPEIDYRVTEAIEACIPSLAMQGWQTSRVLSIGSADLAGARNILASTCYVGPYTHMLFVDADVSWEPGSVERLMAYPDQDLVLGLYPKRTPDGGFFLEMLPGDQMTVDPATGEPAPNGLLEIGAGPTGMMRISRRCIAKMIKAFPERVYADPRVTGGKAWNLFEFTIHKGKRIGEDFNFCRLWREIGGKVWTDPYLMLHHHGNKSYSGQFVAHLMEMAERDAKATASIADLVK